MTPENEEKKNYLMRYRWGKIRIKQIEEEITRLRLSALPGAIKYDRMPHGSGGDADTSRYVAMLDELIAIYRAERERVTEELNEIAEAIKAVEDPRFCILLEYRYIQQKKWGEIASIMGYSDIHVKRLHGQALEVFRIP